MEKILVAGATGTTGNKVVNLLNDSSNYTPIAMVRKESQKKDFESPMPAGRSTGVTYCV